MPVLHKGRIGVPLCIILLLPAVVRADNDPSRREYATPGLVVETGARTMACDVLTFTRDGKYLLAAGDDKVVRTWRCNGGKLEKIEEPTANGTPKPVLRWATYRERRGNIYAAALSPDERSIVVGGLGVTNSQLAVLDRFSGEVKHAIAHVSKDSKEGNFAIWALAFVPGGDQVAVGTGNGSVWLWSLNGHQPLHLGKHEPGKKTQKIDGKQVVAGLVYNPVRALAFPSAGQLLSASENGQVLRWHTNGGGKSEVLRLFSNGVKARRIALSADGRWVAAAVKGNRVVVSPVTAGARPREIVLEEAARPSALVFDAAGKRLAVAISVIDSKASFHKEIGHRVTIYDLSKNPPASQPGLRPTYRVEALAFHPDGKHLAVAGGDDHEVTVWNVTGRGETVGRMVSPGSSLWSVALSRDGEYLAYQTERDRHPSHPNHRGKGAWTLFDLRQLKPAGTVAAVQSKFKPVPLLTKHSEWDVETNSDLWTVTHKGTRYPLGLVYASDSLPLCYTFLAGNGKNPRLLVGHYWGLSVFELIPGRGPVRTRLLTGHEGEVMALAMSADGKRFVTASRDQTINGWSLEDWPSHPQLGAKFYLEGSRLMVGEVDTGSPAWEVGLAKGDEITLLVVENNLKKAFNRSPEYKGKVPDGTAAEALALLKKPEAGKELYFGWRRPGQKKLFEQQTTLRERPLWRFFPTRGGDWVLWRWQDNYYAASGEGDKWIGWQRNFFDFNKGVPRYDVTQTPRFFPAEQFKQLYERPDRVKETLQHWTRIATEALPFPLIEPPHVELLVQGAERDPKGGGLVARKKDLTLTLKASANSPGDNQHLDRVLLWINDYLVAKWEGPDLKVQKVKVGPRLEKDVFLLDQYVIPLHKLRRGDNRLVLQCYNKAQVRGQSREVEIRYDQPRLEVTLHGLFLGVSDYTRAKQPKYWENLRAADDAEALADHWNQQKGRLYLKTDIKLLKDQEVTARAVKKHLEGLAQKVRPDDMLIFFLGGHG